MKGKGAYGSIWTLAIVLVVDVQAAMRLNTMALQLRSSREARGIDRLRNFSKICFATSKLELPLTDSHLD